MKIKIWGVTPLDRVYTNLYEKVTKYEIKPQYEWYDQKPYNEWYDSEKVVEGFNLIIYQGDKKTIEDLSIDTTFTYDKKENQLYVEFHDY